MNMRKRLLWPEICTETYKVSVHISGHNKRFRMFIRPKVIFGEKVKIHVLTRTHARPRHTITPWENIESFSFEKKLHSDRTELVQNTSEAIWISKHLSKSFLPVGIKSILQTLLFYHCVMFIFEFGRSALLTSKPNHVRVTFGIFSALPCLRIVQESPTIYISRLHICQTMNRIVHLLAT